MGVFSAPRSPRSAAVGLFLLLTAGSTWMSVQVVDCALLSAVVVGKVEQSTRRWSYKTGSGFSITEVFARVQVYAASTYLLIDV